MHIYKLNIRILNNRYRSNFSLVHYWFLTICLFTGTLFRNNRFLIHVGVHWFFIPTYNVCMYSVQLYSFFEQLASADRKNKINAFDWMKWMGSGSLVQFCGPLTDIIFEYSEYLIRPRKSRVSCSIFYSSTGIILFLACVHARDCTAINSKCYSAIGDQF